MSLYCLVKNGAVVEGPRELPKNWWKSPTERVNSLPDASAQELKDLGWYPAVVTEPPFDPLTHKKGSQQNTINADDVAVTWPVEEMNQGEKMKAWQDHMAESDDLDMDRDWEDHI